MTSAHMPNLKKNKKLVKNRIENLTTSVYLLSVNEKHYAILKISYILLNITIIFFLIFCTFL